jgi:hypothetical protein
VVSHYSCNSSTRGSYWERSVTLDTELLLLLLLFFVFFFLVLLASVAAAARVVVDVADGRGAARRFLLLFRRRRRRHRCRVRSISTSDSYSSLFTEQLSKTKGS